MQAQSSIQRGQSKSGSGHLLGLNGIRALAVIAVVFHHSHGGFDFLPISHNGFLGVDVFFALSGFLITTLLIKERETFGTISLSNFYARRALRILPLYYAVLALLAVYFSLSGPGSSQSAAYFKELPYHALHVSNWAHLQTMMAVTWSLSTEEQFYLVWPPIFALLGMRALPLLLAFLAFNQAVNFGLADGLLQTWGLARSEYSILQITFTPIVLGVLLAIAFDHPATRAWLNRMITVPTLAASVVALILIANTGGDIQGLPRLLFHVLTTFVLAGIVLRPGCGLTQALEWRPLVYIGKVSYGIYLLHMLAIHFASRLSVRLGVESQGLVFLLAFALTLAMAALSYHYFESPLLRLKSRFTDDSNPVGHALQHVKLYWVRRADRKTKMPLQAVKR